METKSEIIMNLEYSRLNNIFLHLNKLSSYEKMCNIKETNITHKKKINKRKSKKTC